MKKIRTRYAPSPTGFLHFGGARTALFNYIFAKKMGGTFIIRIEDTDVSRTVLGSEEEQIRGLAWLGIVADECPESPNPLYGNYRQSERSEIYQKYVKELLEKNLAYIAYDSPQELIDQRQEQALRGKISFRYDRNWLKISDSEAKKRYDAEEYSIRLALEPRTIYKWNDLVRGEILVNSNDIGDFIIMRGDGTPTYNFAAVIDDHLMEISHIFRGEEHITNTPKQLAIYKYFAWEPPKFGHLTIITNQQGEKLSKRDTKYKQNIAEYQNEGYHSGALFNFMTLLGFTFPDSQGEIRSKEEIIKNFDVKRLSKSPTKFDPKKLDWFAKKYFKNYENSFLIEELGLEDNSWSNLFVEIHKKQVVSMSKLKEFLEIYKGVVKGSKYSLTKEQNFIVTIFANLLNFENFNVYEIQNAIEETKRITKKEGKELFLPIRLATTKLEHGPELASAIFLFGREKIEKRLKNFIQR